MKLKEYIAEELHTRNTNFSNIMHLSVHGSGTDYVAQTIGLLMPKHRWISPNYIGDRRQLAIEFQDRIKRIDNELSSRILALHLQDKLTKLEVDKFNTTHSKYWIVSPETKLIQLTTKRFTQNDILHYTQQDKDNDYIEFYVMLRKCKTKWYAKIHNIDEYQACINANIPNLWTILLIRRDFLSLYLTNFIRQQGPISERIQFAHLTEETKHLVPGHKSDILKNKFRYIQGDLDQFCNNDIDNFLLAIKEWPSAINNILYYEDFAGDYSLKDMQLITKGLPINNIQYHAKKLLSPEKFPHLWKQYQKFPKRFWKTREEKLNTISNVDDLIKDAEKMKKRYKLDNNYYFNPFKYGLL